LWKNEAVIGLTKFFWLIFLTFERDATILRGTLVENVKKSQKSTHPIVCVGPEDDLILPKESEQVDWEVELAVVIGKGGRSYKYLRQNQLSLFFESCRATFMT
jgi:2-keto-4-pentenoate hydratase/2-oxohepta-3-ene-1,7-dioic acid hydratase in catechol pathway